MQNEDFNALVACSRLSDSWGLATVSEQKNKLVGWGRCLPLIFLSLSHFRLPWLSESLEQANALEKMFLTPFLFKVDVQMIPLRFPTYLLSY